MKWPLMRNNKPLHSLIYVGLMCLFPHIIVSPLYTIPLWYVFTSDSHAAMLMPTPTATLLRTTVV